jgi:hypothetical protein
MECTIDSESWSEEKATYGDLGDAWNIDQECQHVISECTRNPMIVTECWWVLRPGEFA